MEYLLDRIRELISGLFESRQLDLVDLKMQREKGRMFLRFFVDKSEGGITLDECANLNTEIGKILDETGIIQESFVLEVSSPGLDRRLITEKDFRRVINKNIRIFLSEEVEGRLEFIGQLLRVEAEKIVIFFNEKEITIPLDKINKAKQVI
jgi:ribosome maturation factor RimP